MASTTIYLESYIESTSSLPTELQRVLTTIKALDEKCQGLQQELRESVAQLLQMPPAHQYPSPQYDELNERVAADHKLLLQFAEEKVQLAQQAHDLLEMHAMELERVTDELDKELRKSNPDTAYDYLNDLGFNTMDSTRGKTPRLDEWAMPPPMPEPVPLAIAPSMQLAAPKKHSAAGLIASKGKRPREEDPPFQLKKKVSMVTMALPAQPIYDEYGLDSAGLPGYEEPIPADTANVPFMRPPPPGYKASATRPQAQSLGGDVHYLKPDDIKPDLVGRHAELFWPDDNLWYLIEIQNIEVGSKEARVLYSTGDFETLNLVETAQNMHMVLVPM